MEEKITDSLSTVRIRVNGAENVILHFYGPTMDEPFLWGFSSREDFATFVKACLRLDERLAERLRAGA